MLGTFSKYHAQHGFQLFLVIPTFIVAILFAAPVLSPLLVSDTTRNLTGILAIVCRLYDIALAVSLSITLLPIGHALCRLLGLRFTSNAEELSFSLFAGIGMTGLAVLLLGLAGLLHPWPIGTLLLLLLVISRQDLRSIHRVIVNGIQTATKRETTLVTVLFLFFLANLLVRTTTPPHVGDELIYHLPATKHYVDAGRIFPNFDNSLANMPFLLHMLYAICLMAGSDIAAKLFSLFLAISTSVALYAFGVRFLTRRIGLLSMFAFFGAGMVAEVAVTSRIDVSLAGMVFISTYAMMVFLKTQRVGWLWVSAALAGFSLSIKHSAALWIVLVGVMYLVEQLRRKEKVFKILANGVFYTCITLFVASPWYIKNHVWFKNPFYPLFTGEVADFGPNGVRYFNKEDETMLEYHLEQVQREDPQLVEKLEHQLIEAVEARPVRHPMRLWEYFTEPNKYLMAERNHYPNYLFVVIPAIAFLPRNRLMWWFLGLGVFYILGMSTSSWIARFWLPAYPALTIVSASVLIGAVKLLRNNWPKKLPYYITAAALTAVLAFNVVALQRFDCLKFVGGMISRNQFEKPINAYSPIHFINNETPQASRVMSVGMQMNYGLRRNYLTDETWFSTKWRRLLIRHHSLEEVNLALKQNGFDYILYNPGLFLFAAQSGIEGAGGMALLADGSEYSGSQMGPEHQLLRNWATFLRYREKFLELVYANEYGIEVLRIK